MTSETGRALQGFPTCSPQKPLARTSGTAARGKPLLPAPAVPAPGMALRYRQPRCELAGSQAAVSQKLAGTGTFPQNTSR